jgi:cbb3-type cytochrome oxidase subunit 1
MPRLSAWFVRAALVYLFLGFTFGGLLLFHKGVPLHPALWRLLPSHIEFVLFGWTAQLIMGMAFWILPRFPRLPVRGNEQLAWAAFILVNSGIMILAISSFGLDNAYLNLIGKVAETVGVIAFGLHALPRIKAS